MVAKPNVTSWGYFNGMGFNQNGVTTKAGVLANLSDGVYLSGNSALAGNPSGTSVGGLYPMGAVLDGNALTPNKITRAAESLIATFVDDDGVSLMVNGKVSMLWGYTSNIAPKLGKTGLIDGGTTADGKAPTAIPVPEPASLLLWSAFGLVGAAFGWRRRGSVR